MVEQKLCLGKISGVFGIRGWIKVFSYTENKENILNYSPWFLQKDSQIKTFDVLSGQVQGKAIVACLDGINSRNEAELLLGWSIYIDADQLPPTQPDEYYWSELVGLKVQTLSGLNIGVVDHMLETGANDVVVVEGEKQILIPFLQPETITSIDLEAGLMTVNWDPDF